MTATGHALADPHMARLATYAQFQPEHCQAQRQQHSRKHGRVGVAELQFELLVDGRGEGLQAEDGQGAELHQHVQGNQQCAADHRGPQQRQGDLEEYPQRLQPRVRADSSREVSRLRRVAATGRNTSGYFDSAMTKIAPPRPSKSELSDTQVKLLTNDGTAKGRHSTTPRGDGLAGRCAPAARPTPVRRSGRPL